MNPYQTETDWHGCYGASLAADPLFPEGRQRPKRERKDKQRKLLGKGLRYAEEVPDPVTHPAKGAPILFNRILDQMLAWGWLKTGDLLADPFGGTGSTAVWWTARHPSNRAVTCEIEARFVAMEQATKAHAEVLLGRPLLWTILHGDSRKLDELLSAQTAVTSPPYGGKMAPGRPGNAAREAALPAADRMGASAWGTGYGVTPGQIEVLPDPVAITSPPYGKGTIGKQRPSDAAKLKRLTETPGTSLYGRNPNGAWFQAVATGYGTSEGNIDLCPDPPAGLTSPPYRSEFARTHNGKNGGKRGTTPSEPGAFTVYGNAEGQIEALPDPIDDRPACALTSPAYEGSLASDDPKKRGGLFRDPKRSRDKSLTGTYEAPGAAACSPPYEGDQPCQSQSKALKDYHAFTRGNGTKRDPTISAALSPPYEAQGGGSGEASRKSQPDPGVADRCGYKTDSNGTAPGQIGAMEKETYADACLAVYSAMARAGIRYACIVVKCPVRNNRRRRLDQLTARLLRQAGYKIRGWRRAWLWQTEGQEDAREGQGSLFDDVPAGKRPKGRLSFFMRLHVAKGAEASQYEDVYFCELDNRSAHERGENGALAAEVDVGVSVEEIGDRADVLRAGDLELVPSAGVPHGERSCADVPIEPREEGP